MWSQFGTTSRITAEDGTEAITNYDRLILALGSCAGSLLANAEAITQDNLDELGRLIYEIRGQRVMLDSDLGAIYGVETKALNRAVKRNVDRFPKDFVFQLSSREYENLRYQIGTARMNVVSIKISPQDVHRASHENG